MQQTKLDPHVNGGDESREKPTFEAASAKSDQNAADSQAGSKRKVDQEDTGEAAEDKHENKTAKKDNGAISATDLATDTTHFTKEQHDADKELHGTDVEDSKAAAQDQNADGKVSWQMTEKGLVYFYYRPKVQAADKAEATSVESLDDLQNTFLLLVPRSSDSETAPVPKEETSEQQDKREPPNPTGYRLISLGKKRLPEPEAALKAGQEPGGIGGSHSEAIWATVAEIGTDIEKVAQGMDEKRYSTRTRGDRVTPAARPAGRGHYIMSIKESDPPSSREVRLTYHISHPSSNEFGDVQKDIGLHPSSSVLLQMRNPTLAPTGPNAPRAGLPADQRAKLSKDELQDTFGGDVEGKGTRYARPEEPSLLDREGVELLLIKSRDQEEDGLQGIGDNQAKALQSLAEEDSDNLSDQAVLNELKLSTETTKVAALSGQWI